MNFKALITGLVVLGSTTAAMASPATVTADVQASWSYGSADDRHAHHDDLGSDDAVHIREHRTSRFVRQDIPVNDGRYGAYDRYDRYGRYDRDGRYDRYGRYDRRRDVATWMTLGTMNQIHDGEMSFQVDPYASRFTTLKLQSLAGKSLIYRVQIEFASGRTQVVELNRYLMATSPAITIDLAGESARAVRNVTVIGRNARQSAYRVLAL